MSISNYSYQQFHDYLTQVKGWSNREAIPKITYVKMAQILNVSASSVSQFLNKTTLHPRKMLSYFIENFPGEFAKWPKSAEKIQRLLTKEDVCNFLKFPLEVNKKIPIIPSKKELTTSSIAFSIPVEKGETSLPLIETSVCMNTVSSRKWTRLASSTTAPIAISYRGHINDKDGKGMVYDHIAFQAITKVETVTLIPQINREKVESIFLNELKAVAYRLPFGLKNKDQVTHPPYITEFSELGLLIIPGRVRAVENEPVRLQHEYRIIREALNRGQPLIGICAGSWRVWEQLFIWTKYPDRLNESPKELTEWHEKVHTLKEVSDHNYGGGMIRVGIAGTITHNVQIHNVVLEKDTLTRSVLGKDEGELSVNSVHWKAVNGEIEHKPLNVRVSSTAKINPTICLATRQKTAMRPTEKSVESFETVHGSPLMGFQWHPEAYKENTPHGKLIKYMVQAGNTYAQKRKTLKQLQEKDYR